MSTLIKNNGSTTSARSGHLRIHRHSPATARMLSGAILALPIGAMSAALLASAPSVHADVYFRGPAGALNDTNWTDFTTGVTGVTPGSGDIGLFNASIGVAQTDSVGGPYTIGELQVTNPTGLVTVSDATQANLLTLAGVNNSAGTTIGIDLSAATQNLTINAPLAVSSNQTWNIAPGRQISLGGANNTNTAGVQALTLNNSTNTITVAGGGTLFVDYFNTEAVTGGTGGWVVNGSTISTTGLVGSPTFQNLFNFLGTGSLTMAASSYVFASGANSGTNQQNFSSLILNPGASTILLGSRGASSNQRVDFTAQPTRNDGGVINLASGNSSSSNVEIGGTSTTLAYATAGSNDFAQTHGLNNTTTAAITAPTYTADAWAATNNTNVTANDAPASGSNTSTLRFNTAAAFSVTLSGINTINNGGILMGGTVGTNSSTVTGGSLTSGDTNADGTHDLILFNNDTTTGGGNLVINSNIVDNAAGTTTTPGPFSVGLTLANTTTNGTTGNVPGSIRLGGSNTFTGATYIDGATVVLTNPTAWAGQAPLFFAPEGSLGSTTNVGTLSLNGNSITVDGLATTQAGTKAIVQNANATAAAITVINSGTSVFSGTIRDGSGGGSLSLNIGGAGIQQLTGTLSYTGATTINSGTLALPQPTSTNPLVSSKSISIAGGATLDVSGLSASTIVLGSQALTGAGTVNGSVTAGTGSIIQPGTVTSGSAGTGTLTINNGLTLNAGAAVDLGLSTSAPAGNLVDVVGALTLPATGKSTFNLYNPNSTTPFSVAGTYDLLQYGTLVNGANLANEFAIGAGASGFTATYGTAAGPAGTSYVTLTLTQSATISQWQGPTTNSNWSNSANWNAGVPSSPGDSATFGTSGTPPTVTLDTNETVGAITFNNPVGYVISGASTLTFDNKGAGASIAVVQGSHTISTPISLNDNLSVQPATGAQVTLSGNITGTSATPTLTLNGAGVLAISGTNTYGPAAGTVGTTLMQGTLQVGSNTAIGAGDVAVTGSGTLQSGAAGLSLANNLILSGGSTLGIDTQTNTLTLSGIISNSSGGGIVTKLGAGTLVLSNSNSYNGGTFLTNGTIQINSNASLGAITGNLTFQGGTLQLGASIASTARKYVIDSGQTAVIDTNSNSLVDSGVISSVGSTFASTADGLIVTSSSGAAGSLTLSANNTFTGQTQINGGTLVTGTALALQNSTLNYNNPAGTLSFGSLTAATFGGLTGSQPLTLNNSSGTAVALTVGGNTASTSFPGGLNGLGSVIKVGNGTLTLGSGTSGGSSYAGLTAIDNGGLTIGGNSNLTGAIDVTGDSGTSSLVIQDNAIVNTTGSILIDTGDANTGAGANQSASSASLVVGGSANVSAGTYAFGNGGNGTRVNATLTVQGSANLNISGTFNLLEEFNGTTSAGGSTINLNGGTLSVGNFTTPTGGDGKSQKVTFNFNGGTLTALASDPGNSFLPTSTQDTADVNTGGLIFNNAAGLTDTIAQALVHGTGTPDGGVTKIGAGTLTLSSTANTYTGPTNVSAGTLVISQNGSLPTGNNVSVGGAGTLVDSQNSILASAGSINVNGHLIVQNSPNVQTITTAVAQGFNGGAWNGSGASTISSSAAANDTTHLHALGVIQNDNGSGSQLYSTFGSYSSLNDSDVLVKYTYYGDADLSGAVDGTDYSRIDNAYLNNQNPSNPQLTGWFNGDFNYDGVIDGSDYTLIDNAYNSQGAAIAAELASPTAQLAGSGSGGSSVPEPASLGLLGLGAAGLLGRRGRRARGN